jgi:HD-like signal output (HDOD) protein
MTTGLQFFRRVIDAIGSDALVLPTLPDVAMRALEMSRRDDVSSKQLADTIGRDPALAARLMRMANGAGYYGQPAARTLVQAVTRVGFRLTGVMAGALASDRLYDARHPQLAERLRRSRVNSVEVAAIARAVARRHTRLDADEAMLGGLLHEIGVLPIVAMAADDPALCRQTQALDEAIFRLHARIGQRLLEAWGFPPPIVETPVACTQFERRHDGPPDIADVVCVALLHERAHRESWLARVDRTRVGAYPRLGIDPSSGILRREGLDDEVHATIQMFET